MKKLIWIIVVLTFTYEIHTCQGQNTETAVINMTVIKATHFEDLTDREKWLLLEKVSEAYFTFNKKEMNQSTLLIYMEEHNPVCEWTGKHVEGKDGKLVRYWTVSRYHVMNILELRNR